MANDEIIIKIGTDVDKAQVQDLEDILNQISNTSLNIKPEVDTTQIQQLESEIEELEAKAVLQQMFGDTTGVEQTQQQIEALQLKIEELKGSAQSIDSTGFDGLSQSADTATQSVTELETSLDGLSMLAVGEVLQQYGDQAEQMAQSINEASISAGQLAIQTGISEPQLRSMIAEISNSTFPQEEAMMYVKSLDQIGVSANNLGTSATDLDKINDAFGLGANTVNSLGQELSVLGVDMNNVSSSFNALAYANANTVGGMQNYYTFLRRYDSQFKELGLNVDQASVLIAGATQKFGGGRAALSGLSRILKESNGDLSVMEQELGLTSGSLSNASQLTGQYTGQLEKMADEEQQHKTILQEVGAAWEDVSMIMGGILAPIGSLIGTGGQLIGVGTQLNGTLELFGKFQGMGNPFINLGTYLSTLTTSIMGVATTIKGSLITAFQSLWGVIIANPIILVVVALAALAAAFIWAYQNVDWFREGVNNAFATVTQFAQTLVSTISSAVNNFTSIIQGIPQALQNCLNWAYDIVMSNPLVQALQWLGQQAVNAFSVLGLGQGSPGKIVGAMENELDWTKEAIEKHSLADTTAALGSDLSSNFNPQLPLNSNSGGLTNNISINIESVDNEDRIQEIVDAVEEALKFDNLTAGRTV